MITIVENLPNVCIRNIVLDSVKESDVEYKITVDVVVKGDDISSLKWYEDEFLLNRLNPYFTPFEDINYEYNNEIINNINIHDEVECIINNLDDFYSSVAENDIVVVVVLVVLKYSNDRPSMQYKCNATHFLYNH